tara:strand:- start:137 stop:316 length:180 start_codon:yes stop_codon:yes gene_type:complete
MIIEKVVELKNEDGILIGYFVNDAATVPIEEENYDYQEVTKGLADGTLIIEPNSSITKH